MKVRLFINDRNYTKWTFHDIENGDLLNITDYPLLEKINPVEDKNFNKDIISIDETHETVYSPIKMNDKIAGVLVLEKNKTYGRTANQKRLLYKCIPDDKHLPAFLVPFDIKIGFSKFLKNKFVVFKYDHWKDKHPYGIITETIGDVDSLENFYEYQLYCKSLHVSLTDFNKDARQKLNTSVIEDDFFNRILSTYPNIEDHRDRYVFTVDPKNSTDFDDGFSVSKTDKTTIITIYIANVYFWLETFALWKSFSKRVATIYLPDRRRPMLPTILSDSLCSLQSNQLRFAFSMRIEIDNETRQIIGEPIYKNAIIKVSRNYCYEDPELLYNNSHYQDLLNITQDIDKTIKTSQEVVSYWMVHMNKTVGIFMAKNKIGIFRATSYEMRDGSEIESRIFNNTEEETHKMEALTTDTKRVIRSWNNNVGKYVLYDDNVSLEHYMMNSQYIHITSPIRRLVDLLNQIILCKKMNIIAPSPDAEEFINNWIRQMEYLNTSMRSIRKIQTDCELVNRCFTEPTIMQKSHVGILFDKMIKNDGTNHYMVYLEDIKLLSRIITHLDIPVYSSCDFKLFLFQDEYNTKRKIRLQIVE